MEKQKEKALIHLFENWAGEKAESIIQLAQSGSYREYYRIKGERKKALGVYNNDKKENIAFINFSKHFFNKGLNVPEIFKEDINNNIYLIHDLGDTTLFDYLVKIRKDRDFPVELFNIYRRVIEELPQFQIYAGKELDYSVCYPRGSFDKQSMLWDLNYFKYYFLKLARIPFDEQKLEDDFQRFSDYLLKTDRDYFMYRDFQSRNVMIFNNTPYFIDYQGGRKGALQYDIASLLYDAKADIPQEVRTELLEHYIDIIQSFIGVNKKEFKEYFYSYVLIRIMQAMGAYGFRGFYEKKEHFLKSIPYALDNLSWILNNISLPVEIPALRDVLVSLTRSERLKRFGDRSGTSATLTVKINSFSYKKGIPEDNSGNGGGFVFDCRALPNPGRQVEYKAFTGKDKNVIEFLEREPEVDEFLKNVFALTDISVENYIKREFPDLMVNLGCTGGQHRSVYCAENLAMHLREKYNINVELVHTVIGD